MPSGDLQNIAHPAVADVHGMGVLHDQSQTGGLDYAVGEAGAGDEGGRMLCEVTVGSDCLAEILGLDARQRLWIDEYFGGEQQAARRHDDTVTTSRTGVR